MAVIAMIVVAVFAAYIFRNYPWLLLKARWYGTETDASVSRIEEEKKAFAGADYYMHYYYVTFLRQDGLQTEARLLNPKGWLRIGEKIRIRYLEEKDDCAVLTGISGK